MALGNRNRQTGQQQGQQGQQATGQQGEIRSKTQVATAFPIPYLGLVDGQQVKVLAFGDIPGHSPAYLCVDDQGDTQWISMDQVQIIDPNALPLTQNLIDALQQTRNNNR